MSVLDRIKAQKAAAASKSEEPAQASAAESTDEGPGGLDLNDREVTDYSERTPSIPFDATGAWVLELLGVTHHAVNACFYKASCKVIEALQLDGTPHPEYREGKLVDVLFFYEPNARSIKQQTQNKYASIALRKFVAACEEADFNSPDFNGNKVLGSYVKATQRGEFEPKAFVLSQEPYTNKNKERKVGRTFSAVPE